MFGRGVAAVAGVQLITQVAQPHALITRDMRLRHAGQAAGEADVGIVAALEFQQFGQQRAPFAFGDAHGKQHQE
ncbi:hypothetical protein D3C85_1566260 [compost metagenome]